MNCECTHVDIEFIKGLEWKSLEKAEAQKRRILLALDDLFDEAAKKQKNSGTSYCRSILQHTFGGFKTQSISTDKKIKNNRLECHADYSLQQPKRFKTGWDFGTSIRWATPHNMGERHLTMKAHKGATRKTFGHLIIDLDARSSETLRLSSEYSGDEPSLFYCSTDQLHLNLGNECTKFLYSWFVH